MLNQIGLLYLLGLLREISLANHMLYHNAHRFQTCDELDKDKSECVMLLYR